MLSNIESSPINFTEGDAATQITNTVTVSDTDNVNMTSAVVRITSNYVKGEDVLSYTKVGSITGSFDASTGKMTLTGNDTKANYQSALRSVAYLNTSNNPDTSLRTVSFTVSDGSANSNIEKREIKVTAVDDPPVISFQFRPITIKENKTLTLTISQLYPFISDPDNPDSTLSVSYSYKGDNLKLISKTDTSIRIKPKENWFGLDTVTVTVSDGTLSTTASFAVNVLFVNNPPRFDNLPTGLTVKGGDTTKVNIFNWVSDVETPDDSLKYNFTAGNDSLLYSFNTGSGVLSLYSTGDYAGATDITIGVTDKNGGTADIVIAVNVEAKITGIKALAGTIPKDYEVYQNYPNPFNPTTVIRYGLPEESKVVIRIYNILGQQVSTLFSGTERAGYYEETFNANQLSSGIYIYTVAAESAVGSRRFSTVRKMILLK